MNTWHDSMACLQLPPSLEEVILVRECKVMEALPHGFSWRCSMIGELPATLDARCSWEGADRRVSQVALDRHLDSVIMQ